MLTFQQDDRPWENRWSSRFRNQLTGQDDQIGITGGATGNPEGLIAAIAVSCLCGVVGIQLDIFLGEIAGPIADMGRPVRQRQSNRHLPVVT